MEENIRARIAGICENLPPRLRVAVLGLDEELLGELTEIRLRRERPVGLTMRRRSLFLGENGALSVFVNGAMTISGVEMEEIFLKCCNHSVYTYQNDIKNGFITLAGGHRVGICGTTVLDERGEVCGVRDISTLNIRIAREVRGAADRLLREVTDGKNVDSLLIASPPKCGKTTILRDLARQLSEQGFQISVIDERGELAAVRSGVPQCDVGPASDIYTAIGKAEGISRALRTMSPEVILCDEIGSEEDANGILAAMNCGVQMIATAHASGLEELQKRPQIARLIESGVFCKGVLLNRNYEIAEIREWKRGYVRNDQNSGARVDLSLLRGDGYERRIAAAAQN